MSEDAGYFAIICAALTTYALLAEWRMHRMQKRHDAETVQAAVAAHAEGESMQSIAARLGVPYGTVYGWCTMLRRWRDVVVAE